jgi:glycosyltransferase involved in cell wall biosynthesis
MAPARAGGLESVVVELTSGLRHRNHDVQVAAVLAPGTEEGHPVVQALRVREVPVHVLVLGTRDYLGERRAVRDLLRRLDAQVLHTHGYRADAVLGDVARGEKRANVITLHGFVGGSRRGRLYEWLQVQAARFASGVIAVSTPIVQRLQSHGITRNVQLVRNAVAPAANALSRAQAREALHLPAEAVLVGWVGRVSHEKGPDHFVEALSRAAPAVHGVMIGDGPELEASKRRAQQRGIADRMHFCGMVPGASRYLAAFDAVALTSRTEGTPMILLESMWAQVPIVATAVGGVPDVLSEHEAVLCAPGDVQAIADAFGNILLMQVEARARATAANDRVATEYAFESWLDKHEALYRRVIGR